MKTMLKNTPRIYVACVENYNNGNLLGKWIDATKNVEEIKNEINYFTDGEFAIHDFEGFFCYKVPEYAKIQELFEVAHLIKKYEMQDEGKGKAFTELTNFYDLEYSKCLIEEQYAGCYESKIHFVEQYVEDTGILENVSHTIKAYFDFDSLYRDMEMNGEIFCCETSYNKCHFFYTY